MKARGGELRRRSWALLAIAAGCAVLPARAGAAVWRGAEARDRRDPAVVAGEFVARRTVELGLGIAEQALAVDRRSSPSGSTVRLGRYLAGFPVVGGEVVVHVRPDGSVDFARTRDLPPLGTGLAPALSADEAERIARTASAAAPSAVNQHTDLALVPGRVDLRLAWEVWLFSDDPVARWRVFVDAESGAVLRADDMVVDVSGSGKVFDPNPVVKLQNPNLLDQGDSDAAVPAAAYDTVTLQSLDPASGGLYRLSGPWVRAIDIEAPAGAPPAETTPSFLYTRAHPGFEWVMVYHHIDGVQRFYQSLGFSNVNDRRIDVDAHGLNGADNAHYVPNGFGTGYIAMGDGGVDDGEDGEVIVHEYGHAVHDNQRPMCFLGAESGAMGEGFGDFNAVSYFLSVSGGFQDACVSDWDAVSYSGASPPCLRRVDNAKRYPESIVGEVHADGEIWSGALWDILLALSGGPTPTLAARATIVQLLLESHFLLPSDPSFYEGAQALLDADEMLFGGAHRDLLVAKLDARGILPPPPTIWGGVGPALFDCFGAFRYANPANPYGATSNRQQCTDGDPTCDADGTVGQCTFRVRFCFDQTGLPACTPNVYQSFEIRAPRPDDRKPSLAALGEALTAAVDALPGSTRGGLHDNQITWSPYSGSAVCTSDVDLVVPMKLSGGRYRKATVTVRTRVVLFGGKPRDDDAIRLSCVP